MKKILPLLILALICCQLSSFAQIPNGDFENLNSDGTISNWGNVYITQIVVDSSGNVVLDSIVADGPYYQKTTDAYSGMYAMEMRNSYDFTLNTGRAGSVSSDADSVYSAWGSLEFVNIQMQPTDFSFYYKYTSVGNDTGIASLIVYDTLGYQVGNATVLFTGSNSTYQYVSMPVQYTGTDPVAFYSLNFSTKFSAADYPTSPNLGSRLTIDDVRMSGTTGIESSGLRENNFSLYPNPARNLININSKYQGEVNFKIFDAFGKVVASGILSQGIQTISVSSFDAGIYSMDLNCTGKSVQSRFVVIK
ncbi:MAG TPA: T9SS type A sorting domain-containing protein [Bacteroidia bacterium]|nr:T9SS type A sorting domain-containing protein [Bacteroidia bacterium]HNP98307.1 T9SS type A sorting domain-containing protein [Bacteroidia bacterium]